MKTLRNSEPAAEPTISVDTECEYAIWCRACTLRDVYSKAMAVETLRRLADEMEGLTR